MSVMTGKFFDIARFVIWADEESEHKTSRMIFSFRDGNPRLTVYVNDKEVKPISFPCDAVTMTTIAQYIEEVADAEPGFKVSIDSLARVYEDNKPTDVKKLVSTLFIGKTQEGVVYLSVVAEDKPKLIFFIKPSPYHVFKDKDKNVIPEAVISCRLAKAIASMIKDCVTIGIFEHSKEQGLNSDIKENGYKTNGKGTVSNTPELDDLEL